MPWIYLAVAIVAETIGTAALKASDGFARVGPTAIAICGFLVALFCLSVVLKSIPMGVTYAIWSGLGIVLITAFGFLWFKQSLDAPAMIGMGLIIAGVVVMNVFSDSVSH